MRNERRFPSGASHLTHQEEDGDGGGLLLEVAAAGASLLPHHGDQHDGETHQTNKSGEANPFYHSAGSYFFSEKRISSSRLRDSADSIAEPAGAASERGIAYRTVAFTDKNSSCGRLRSRLIHGCMATFALIKRPYHPLEKTNRLEFQRKIKGFPSKASSNGSNGGLLSCMGERAASP